MKLSPALLALAAAGVAAFVLFRPRAAAQPPQRGFLDRVETVATGLENFVTWSADYALWGDLSAVRDDRGRIYSTVPITGPDYPADVSQRDASLGVGEKAANWVDRYFNSRNVTTFGEPY